MESPPPPERKAILITTQRISQSHHHQLTRPVPLWDMTCYPYYNQCKLTTFSYIPDWLLTRINRNDFLTSGTVFNICFVTLRFASLNAAPACSEACGGCRKRIGLTPIFYFKLPSTFDLRIPVIRAAAQYNSHIPCRIHEVPMGIR